MLWVFRRKGGKMGRKKKKLIIEIEVLVSKKFVPTQKENELLYLSSALNIAKGARDLKKTMAVHPQFYSTIISIKI